MGARQKVLRFIIILSLLLIAAYLFWIHGGKAWYDDLMQQWCPGIVHTGRDAKI